MAEAPDTGVRPADTPPSPPRPAAPPAAVGYARLTGLLGVAFAMAGMYAITTTTLLLHAGLLPRWVALLSYLMAAVMLVSTTLHPALLLVFPGWVALAGLIVLSRTGRSGVRTSPRSRP
jgi:hypothetical protein